MDAGRATGCATSGVTKSYMPFGRIIARRNARGALGSAASTAF
jgi:hypothetical protein